MISYINWKMVLAAIMIAGPATAGCVNTIAACKIGSGTYHILLPKNHTAKTPTVMFLHGYGSTGKILLRNKRITAPILQRGYAIIAPNALTLDGGHAAAWNFHPGFNRGRNEAAFLEDVIDNAVKKFNLDRKQTLLAGFSLGGSMTSYLACNTASLFTAYAPIAGSFWRPHPVKCTKPVKLFHTHGQADRTVPLKGRKITDDFIQGNVYYALNLWRRTNACAQQRAEKTSTIGIFTRSKWENCDPNSALEFALFPGGHTVPKGWANMILDWYEELPD